MKSFLDLLQEDKSGDVHHELVNCTEFSRQNLLKVRK